MYLEREVNNRDSWKFSYTGQELLPYVDLKMEALSEQESQDRQEIADIMNDRTQSLNSEKVDNLKRSAEKNAREKELCHVIRHECVRKPSREFVLTVGDVVYFGIHLSA